MGRYAIVDSSQRGGFHKRLDRYGVEYISLFAGHAEESLLDIAPLLISLGHANVASRATKEIEQLAAARPAVSMLESDLELAALAHHLQAFHTIKLPERKEMILRWYDTRVLPVWMEVMNGRQRAGFVHGIGRWTYWDRFGDLLELELGPQSPFPPLTPYALDEAQLVRLQAASETDVLLAQLRRIIPDEIASASFRQLYPFVDQHLRIARQHGLVGLDERAQFLLLALFTGGAYLENTEVASRMMLPCREQPVPFQDWIDALPDAVWHVGRPLWSESPMAKESA